MNRYDGPGKGNPDMVKDGKYRRKAQAAQRRMASDVRECGHVHTDNGAQRCPKR